MANFRSDTAVQHIKAAVSVREVLERNGYHPDRQGLVLCPFHSEKTPSFRVYSNGKGWYCFGCHKGGDVINLASALYGTKFADTLKRLDREFNLHLFGRDDRTPAQRRADSLAAYAAKQERQRVRMEREQLKERWGALNARAQELRERIEAGDTDADPFELVDIEVKRDTIGWKLDGDI